MPMLSIKPSALLTSSSFFDLLACCPSYSSFQTAEQISHTVGHDVAVVQLAVNPYESQKKRLVFGHAEQLLVQPVCLAHLSFRPVSADGVPELSFRCTHKDTRLRIALFAFLFHINHAQGKCHQGVACLVVEEQFNGFQTFDALFAGQGLFIGSGHNRDGGSAAVYETLGRSVPP